jgi:hypothetical protein
MSFLDQNADWINHLRRRAAQPGPVAAAQSVKDYLQAHGAAREPYAPLPLVIDKGDFDALAAAGAALLSAQGKILRALCSQLSRPELMDLFGLSRTFESQIDWDKLVSGEQLITRFDIVPTGDGYSFCEINCDTTVGGFEFCDCHKLYAQKVGLSALADVTAPHQHIAELLAALAARHGFKRLLVCEWSSFRNTGRFGFDYLCGFLRRELPHLEVRMAHEDDYPADWLREGEAADLLVYRGFMFEDMSDGGAFFARLQRSGATIVHTFETEIRSNKRWFQMFGDARFQHLLSPAERAAIRDYVPTTQAVTADNLDKLLQQKASYVFKLNNSNSGRGVLIGAERGRDELLALITAQGVGEWTVQPVLDSVELVLPEFDGSASPGSASHRLVLGLYLVDGRASGVNVRASKRSRIVSVNLGTGCWLWASPLGAEVRRALQTETETKEQRQLALLS